MTTATSETGGRLYLLGDVATHFGAQSWQVARLFKRGLLPEPERLGRARVVREEDLPAIEAALRQTGYLK